jgi:hypothetical protein
MRIAIISNGPSAGLYEMCSSSFGSQRLVYDRVLAVTWAACRWSCDWWVFGDGEVWDQCAPTVIGYPQIFCREKVRASLPDSSRIKEFEWTNQESRGLRDAYGIGPPAWNMYSGLAAIGLAYWLGATELDLFGFDMAGRLDVRNEENPSRSDKRWKLELQGFGRWCNILKDRGCVIRRIVAESPAPRQGE